MKMYIWYDGMYGYIINIIDFELIVEAFRADLSESYCILLNETKLMDINEAISEVINKIKSNKKEKNRIKILKKFLRGEIKNMNKCTHINTYKSGKRIYFDGTYQMHKCKDCSKLIKGIRLYENLYNKQE